MESVIIFRGYANDENKELHTYFYYKGYYCKKGGKMAFHTPDKIKEPQDVSLLHDDDVFTMDSTAFDDYGYFKEVIDNHIEVLKLSFGSLDYYYSLN